MHDTFIGNVLLEVGLYYVTTVKKFLLFQRLFVTLYFPGFDLPLSPAPTVSILRLLSFAFTFSSIFDADAFG